MKIKVENLTFAYTSEQASLLNEICCSFEFPGVYFLTGRNGTGKSTLGLLLNGTYTPINGTVKIGENIVLHPKVGAKDIKAAKRTVGYVFQFPEHQLFEYTVARELEFGCITLGGLKRKEIPHTLLERALEEVGLSPEYLERNPFELSGGEQRRVTIASTLVISPEVIIFDEPTVGLDSDGKTHLRTLIEALGRTKIVIVITHDREFAYPIKGKYLHLEENKISFFEDGDIWSEKQNRDDQSMLFKMKKARQGSDVSPYKKEQIEKMLTRRGINYE
ncbi:MAG: energy-coupling factor ABC transporter ATP-binding protein [Bacilli bacterium]